MAPIHFILIISSLYATSQVLHIIHFILENSSHKIHFLDFISILNHILLLSVNFVQSLLDCFLIVWVTNLGRAWVLPQKLGLGPFQEPGHWLITSCYVLCFSLPNKKSCSLLPLVPQSSSKSTIMIASTIFMFSTFVIFKINGSEGSNKNDKLIDWYNKVNSPSFNCPHSEFLNVES